METVTPNINNVDNKYRIAVLIKQLTALQQQDAPSAKLLPIAQLLTAELSNEPGAWQPPVVFSKYITIMEPPFSIPPAALEKAVATEETVAPIAETVSSQLIKEQTQAETVAEVVPEQLEKIQKEAPESAIAEVIPTVISEQTPLPEIDTEKIVPQIAENEVVPQVPEPEIVSFSPSPVVTPEEPIVEIKEEEPKQFNLWESMADDDVPTLSLQPAASVNDTLAAKNQPLSEAPTTEFPQTPIKDLKKAISINDRFLFINELFRGDESAYERSLKTINGFRIRPEADFWIERELKVKLGWDDKSPAVAQFFNLVQRRFS